MLASRVRILIALMAFSGLGSVAQAQDWDNYYHWPYVPPQVPGQGFEYQGLYDGFYTYPREQRWVPQIQGPYYRNFLSGKRHLGHSKPSALYKQSGHLRFYQGYHFVLDVF